jgi:hypothetical protein
MANKRITDLTLGTPDANDVFPYSDSTPTTYKTTPDLVVNAGIGNRDYFEINYLIGNAGTTAITQTGMYPYFRVNRAGSILGVDMFSGTIAGNATVQVWKGNYGTPPTGTAQNIIGAGSSMTMTGGTKYQATTTAWGTQSFGSGDVFSPYLSGVGTIPFLAIAIHCKGL